MELATDVYSLVSLNYVTECRERMKIMSVLKWIWPYTSLKIKPGSVKLFAVYFIYLIHGVNSYFTLLAEGIICGFEGDLVGTCGAVFSNIYYDNPNQYGRSWDIATSGSTSYGAVGPAEGQYYWNAGTEYTYTTPQYGTLSLAPTKVAGNFLNISIYHKVSWIFLLP